MTKLREAAQQALEALIGAGDDMDVAMQDAFVALRAALAQPEPEPWMGVSDNPYASDADCNDPNGRAMSWHNKLQALAQPEPEPVAWGCFRNGVLLDDLVSDEASVDYWCESDEPEMQRLVKRALYTAPPQRKPLTDEEIMNIGKKARAVEGSHILPVTFARAIEQAHGIGAQP